MAELALAQQRRERGDRVQLGIGVSTFTEMAALVALMHCLVVWLDERCAKDENLDRKDLYRTNYEATKLAIARAIRGEPTIDELIANRKTVKHYSLEGLIEY